MTLRSRRLMPGLLAVLVVLALTAPSSFAQVSLTLTPTPSPEEIDTNHAAQTNDPSVQNAGILVTGQLLATSPLTSTVLNITYPATVASSPSLCDTGKGPGSDVVGTCSPSNIPPEDPILIIGATGVFAGLTGPVLNTNLKRIEIVLPTSSSNSLSGSFRLVGVRVDMNGATAPVTAAASLSNAANNYLLTTTSVSAVNAAAAGIASVASGVRTGSSTPSSGQGTVTIFSNNTVTKGTGSFVIKGGFAGAWRNTFALSNSGTAITSGNSTRVRLTFTGIPTGVSLTLSLNGSSGLGAVFGTESGSGTTTVTASANTPTIAFTSAPLTSTPQLEVDITSTSVSGTAVLTPGSITATATMAPVCTTIVGTNGEPTEANGYPCFNDAEVGPVTVASIVPTNTTMLMPYALFAPPYDTGIAIANTTADPFGASGGGATPTAGTLTFTFFPTYTTGTQTTFSLTTSATAVPAGWTGIASDGTVPAGATAIGLLSQLLSAAGHAGPFQGYIFITANFLDAHGTATISDFRTYSLTANVLVLPPPATSSRNNPNPSFSNSVEALHF